MTSKGHHTTPDQRANRELTQPRRWARVREKSAKHSRFCALLGVGHIRRRKLRGGVAYLARYRGLDGGERSDSILSVR